MARTAITITELDSGAQSTFTLAAVGGALDATNHHVITPTGDIDPRELVLMILNTTSSEKDVTIKAGDNPPATHTSGGDEVVVLGAGNTTVTHALIPIDPSRQMQSDGTIEIDVESGMTGRIACFRLPRTA